MTPDRLLFGQFLIEEKKINKAVLDVAMAKQDSERITDKPRMLGAILLNDFNVFRDRIELKHYLDKFEIYKSDIRNMYITAKTYGVSPNKKLASEYADLMEELEAAPTIKIRELIKMIEKFKIAIKEVKSKDDEIIKLKKEIEEKDEKLETMRRKLSRFERDINRIDGIKQLKKRNND